MNSELKNKWVAALRSGDYAQTEEVLKDTTCGRTHCCLGVLLEISELGRWIEKNGNNEYEYEGEKCRESLTQKLLDEVGLKNVEETYLIELNDERGYTFEQIADVIEGGIHRVNKQDDLIYQNNRIKWDEEWNS